MASVDIKRQGDRGQEDQGAGCGRVGEFALSPATGSGGSRGRPDGADDGWAEKEVLCRDSRREEEKGAR